MAYFVYVLRSGKDGKRYVGITNNIERRLKQHNNSCVQSTKCRLPLKLEYKEEHPDRLSARNRERYFKSAAGRRFLDKHI
jgi:putative endonuclease